MQIPRGYQKKCLLRRKSAILSVRWKFQCISSKNHCGAILIRFGDTLFVDTFCGSELGPKTQFAVSAACTQVKKAFKSFGTIRIKNSFC